MTHRKSNSETEGRVICQTVRHVPECIVDLVLILIITWYKKSQKNRNVITLKSVYSRYFMQKTDEVCHLRATERSHWLKLAPYNAVVINTAVLVNAVSHSTSFMDTNGMSTNMFLNNSKDMNDLMLILIWTSHWILNLLRPRQNGHRVSRRHFQKHFLQGKWNHIDSNFKRNLVNENGNIDFSFTEICSWLSN